MKRNLLAVFLGLLLCAAPSRSEDLNEIGKKIISEAVETTNIFSIPSFQMKTKVVIENAGGQLDGSYTLHWNGPDQWREDIQFPGYNETQFGSKGMLYVSRSTDFSPLRILQLHFALGYGSAGSRWGSLFNQLPSMSERVTKIHDRKVDSIKAECVEIVDSRKKTREVCVDSSTRTLLRDDLDELFVASFYDGDLQPSGPKLFFHSLVLKEAGKNVVQVQVTDFKVGDSSAPGFFDPPAGLPGKRGCMNPVPMQKISDVVPRYPDPDRRSLTQGTVDVYAVVDKTGKPALLRVIRQPSPTLGQATLDSVQKWRYEPASCAGEPVDSEALIEVHYTFGH